MPSSTSVACATCPVGMSCSETNTSEAAIPAPDGTLTGFPFVKAAPGYMTMRNNPMKPYKCHLTAACPGARAGTCDLGRDPETVGCGACPHGTYSDAGGRCKPCEGSRSEAPVAIAICAVVFAATCLALKIQRKDVVEPRATATIATIGGLTILTIQSLGVINNLSLEFV